MVLSMFLAVIGCTSQADIREHRLESEALLIADADALFAALEATAAERGIPIARRDERRRRLTSEWLPESETVRHRYFLSVLMHTHGLAIRVHLSRESMSRQDDIELWEEVEPTQADAEEELSIVSDANERWESP